MTNSTTSSASSMTRWLTELEGRSDPRVSDWPLMSSPLPTVVLCLTYLVVVKVVGPLLMKDRPPFQLQYPMLVYNLFQVLFNGWIFLGELTPRLGSHWSSSYITALSLVESIPVTFDQV